MKTKQDRHDHTHGMVKQTLRLAFFLSLLIVTAEVGGGLLAHSLALLSDAGHALTDIFAPGLVCDRPSGADCQCPQNLWLSSALSAHIQPANVPLVECSLPHDARDRGDAAEKVWDWTCHPSIRA